MEEKTADEIWLTIKQNNNYEINNIGKVRNKKTKKILKPAISNKGYYLVSLSNKCKAHTYTVHKLVMEHFNRCSFNKEVINHIDGNKLNNNIDNLEYVTQKENVIKAWKNNLCENIRKSAFNIKHSRSIKTSKPVIQYDLDGNILNKFVSVREAEEKTGIDNSLIIRVCKGKQKLTHNFIFRYAEELQAINKKVEELQWK